MNYLSSLILLVLPLALLAEDNRFQPLPLERPSDRFTLRNCQAVSYQSPSCQQFIESQCSAIGNNNLECLNYLLTRCYQQGKDDEVMVNSEKCRVQEEIYCRANKYKGNERVCDKYHLEYCSTLNFKTRTCLLLKQRVVIDKQEEKYGEKAYVAITGHVSTKRAKDSLPEQINGMDKERAHLAEQIFLGIDLAENKKKIKELEKQIDKAKNELEDAIKVFEICQKTIPLKPKPPEPPRSCNSNNDSTCMIGMW